MRFFQTLSAAKALCLLAFASLLTSVSVPVASAQGIITGGITGSVVDSTGAVIPGASIEAKNESTGILLQAKSDAEGAFRIADVPIGSYAVTVKATSFGPAQMTHVVVVAGNSTPLGKVSLSLGKTVETVQVEGSASELINTESAQGESVLDAVQLATVPVAGALDNVTLMVPGVVQQHQAYSENTNGITFSVNGERGRANNSEIDGQSNNDDSIGGPSFFFSNQDALQEMQVVTTDMGAQYGRNFGSVVNYISKSGTNSFHGTAFENYLGSFLSSLTPAQKAPQYGFCPGGSNAAYAAATGCALAKVPRFVENIWGGTLGGPVLKNKLWLFGSTYWVHEHQSGAEDTSGEATFPDAAGLTALQAAFPNNPGVAALVTNGPYSIPSGNPQAVESTSSPAIPVQVTDGNTVATITTAPVERALTEHVLDQEELGRLDYQMDPKDRFYLRYDYQNNPWVPAWYLYSASGIAAGGISQVYGISHQVGGDWTHTFTPTISNQIRYSFQQTKIGFDAGGQPNCSSSNFNSCSSVVTLTGTEEGFGYGYDAVIPGNSLPQGRVVREDQVQDNAQWTKGRHTILFGGEYDFHNSPNYGLPNSIGGFNFTPSSTNPLNFSPGSIVTPSGSATTPVGPCEVANTSTTPVTYTNVCNNGFTGILEGVGTLSLAQGKTTVPFREPDFAFYGQDNFKLMKNLTLNLGLRWEYFSPSVNLIHSESVAQQTGSDPFWSTSLPLSATTFPTVNPSYRNFEPRIGLAYVPNSLPKMVVHAGFTINVDAVFSNIFLNMAQTAPVVNAGVITCDGVTVKCEPNGGFTFATVQAADDKYLPTGGDPRVNPITTVPANLRNPMAETYNLGIQYQVAPAAVAEVRYVGNHTFDNFQSLNTNPDILDVQSAFPSYGSGINVCTTMIDGTPANGYGRPNCDYNAVDTEANTAFSIYNALQTTFTVRDFHHWTGTVAYTYSRTIDNTSELFSYISSGSNTNAFAQDPLDSDRAERGVFGNSYPSVWGIQLTYTEPWFKSQRGILGELLGGFFLNNFYQYNGGQPYSPFQDASMESSKVTVQSSTSAPPSAADIANVETNFCDSTFGIDFDYGGYVSQCRPILANKGAPMNTVGINAGQGVYENYVTGSIEPRDSFHWLWNNKAEAIALGKPFPGVSRNTLRGATWNDWDASLGKNFKATERVTVQLTMNVFNVLNRAYYGVPDPNLEDSLGSPNTYLQSTFTGYNPGTAAGGGAYYAGFGNRNIQLSGHIVF